MELILVPDLKNSGREVYFNRNDGHFVIKVGNFYKCGDNVTVYCSSHNKSCSNKPTVPICQYSNKIVPLEKLVHNHPPPTRHNVEFFLFRWKCLQMVIDKFFFAPPQLDLIREVYEKWPFYFPRNIRNICRKLSATLMKRSRATTWSKRKDFLEKYPSDRFQNIMESNTNYWGPPHFGKIHCI